MKRTLVISAVLAMCVLSACKDKEETVTPAVPAPKASKDFAPPADGKVQPERVALWKQADSLVRLVDSVFLDSIRKNSGETARYLAERDAARDAAARKVGLLGWKEYSWILETAARDPENAASFEKAGVSVAVNTVAK